MKSIKQFLVPWLLIILVSFGISPHALGQGQQVFSTPGAGAFTIPPGVATYTIKLWGGGGGGGNTPGTEGQGGGGGGAFQVLNIINYPANIGGVYGLSVGAGGTAGNPGGNTTAGNTFIAAGGNGSNSGNGFGGVGGVGSAQGFVDVTSSFAWSGGNGGASTNPQQTSFGGGGGGRADNGNNGGNGTNGGTSGSGAPGVGGLIGGGAGGNTGASGGNATNYGGGGGGRGFNGPNSGTGGNGRIEFSWPCPTLTSLSYNSPTTCSYSSPLNPTVLPSSATGGTYSSATLGQFLNANTGVIATGAPQGTHTITYGWPAFGGCPAASVTFTLTIAPQAVATGFSYSGTPFCTNAGNGSPSFTTLSGVQGVYSAAAGLSINANSGVINPSASTPGTYTVTYTVAANGNCNAVTASTSVTITALPTISNFDYPPEGIPNKYCAGAGIQLPTSSVTNPNNNTISYSYTTSPGLTLNTTTGAINPATSTPGVYIVTMTIASGGGCAAVTANSTVEILARPTATIAYTGNPFCQTVGSTMQSISITGVTGGPLTTVNFSYVTAPGLTLNTATGAIDLNSIAGTYTVKYRFTGANGCLDSSTTSVTIKPRPTSTLTYAAGTNPICSNTSPVLSGNVTAVGPWTLTLSNGQTATGTGNGAWSIAVNTLNPGQTATYTVTGLMDANCSGVAAPDMPGSVTITKRTTTSGSIPTAANVKVCEGLDASINVTLTSPAQCAPTPQFSGMFKIEKWNGAAWIFQNNYPWTITVGPSTTGIAAAINIPPSNFPNPTSNTLLYRVSWVSLVDCNGCSADPLTGSVVIESVPTADLIISAAPIGDVCPGSNMVFTVNQTTTIPNAVFNWEATDASGNVLGSGSNVSFGTNVVNTNLGLSCPYNGLVTFTFNSINPNCCNCIGAPIVRTVMVRDIVKPTWVTAAGFLNRTVECDDATALAAAQALAPTATDNCDNNLVIVKTTGAFVSNGAPCTQSGTRTNSFTVTDACGNVVAAPFIQVITIVDTKAPVLTGTIPAGQTGINNCLSNAPVGPTVAAIAALYTDACGTVVVTKATTTTGTDCGWTVTYTYTVKDNCGNTVTASPTVVYSGADLTAPVLIQGNTFPIGQTELNLCLSQAPAGPTTAAIAALYSDNCGGAITVLKTAVTTGTDCNWTVVYTYSIKDKCGNEVTPKPTVTYQGFDATAPVLINENNFPAGQTGINNCLANAPVGPTTTAIAALYSDNCGGAITVVKTSASTGTDCQWTVTYTYSIKDKCGNEVLPRPTVVYSGADQTAPTLGSNTFPVGATLINSCQSAAPVGPTEAAIAALYADNCGGAITVVKTSSATGNNCAWSVTYTYSIKDKCGNEVLPRPTITYSGGDKTAPTLIIPGSFPVGAIEINGCIGSAPVGPTTNAIAALYQDNCGGTITVLKSGTPTGTNCTWSVTYTYTITDACNNAVTPSPTVTYSGGDVSAPVFTNIIPTQTINTGAGANCSGIMPDYTPLANVTDCGTFTLEQLAPNAPGTMVFGFNGSRNVVIKATDACGNISTTTFVVLLKDLTPPVALCKPYTVILNAAGNGSIVLANINNGSYDNCTPTSQLVFGISQTTFTCANVGTNSVILTVTDLCFNVSTCTALVTVIDNTAPVISCFGDTTINKDANCTYTMPDLTFRVNKADACGFNANSVTQSIPVGSIFGASVTSMPVTLTVTDKNGNSSTCTFTMNFVDVTPPVIAGCPTNITVNTGFGNALCSQTATWTPPTATDACIICCSTQPITGNYAPGATFPVGVTTVTYTATDVSGNTSTCSFTVTVIDNTKPLIANCPSNLTVNTGVGRTTCNQIATWIEPTATDNCTAAGSLIRTRSHVPGSVFPVGVTTVTYTFTDVAGNVSLPCIFTVTVIDNTVPIITCPGNIVNPPINTAGCLATVVTANPTFSDNCQVTKLTWAITGAGITPAATSPTTGINFLGTRTFNFGVTTVTYTATDASGNTATCSYTVSVTRPLSSVISGTSTVLQNNTGTSNILFTTKGGTAPYTIVYTAPAGGFPSAGTQTIITTGTNSSTVGGDPNWLVTTVPQSSAIAGVYTYTLVSVTDFYGCVVTPNTTATVTVVTTNYPAPDLTPSFSLGSPIVPPTTTKFAFININNISPNVTTGAVYFEVYAPSNFNLTIGETTTLISGITVNNNDFDIVNYPGLGYAISSKPGVIVPAGTNLKIGYNVDAAGSNLNSGDMIVILANGTGGVVTVVGDNNSSNNKGSKKYTISN